jgi:hypothetical protein
MADALPNLRWFHLAPHHCLGTLLAVEGLLWLSKRLGWPPWHKGYAVLTAVAAVAVMMLLMLLWFGVAALSRWRFQFGIRSLFVLTVAVALPCSWFSWEMKMAREQRDAAEAIRKAGLMIAYDYQCDTQGFWTTASWSGPNWVHSWLGDDFLSDIVGVQVPIAFVGDTLGGFCPIGCKATDQDLLPLKKFSRLRHLYLAGTSITDSGMACVGKLRELQSLSLLCTNVGDNGVAHLRGLRSLRDLDISQTKVTNSGLAHVKNLPHLESIRLGGTAVDDNGLLSLAECRRIKKVNLMWHDFSHQFTPKGVARFKRAMPNCDVIQ